MARQLVRKNAPYFYIAQDQLGSFQLFVYVPINSGYIVNFGSPSTNGNTISIPVEVVPNTGSTATHAQHVYQLSQGSATKIVVTNSVKDSAGHVTVSYQSTLLFSECDDTINTNDISSDYIAYNCPYIHLQKDNAKPNTYIPHLIVWLKGYNLENDLAQKGSGGNYKAELTISVSGNSTPTDVTGMLSVNAITYLDSSGTGAYTAEIDVVEAEAFAVTTSSRTQKSNSMDDSKLRTATAPAMPVATLETTGGGKKKAKTSNANT